MYQERRNGFKNVLQLMSQLLWVVGLVVGLSGAHLMMKYRHSSLLFSQTYITLPAVVVLISAAVLLVTGCLGSWLSLRNSYCLQGVFVYMLAVVFCLQITASALAYFHYVELDSETAPLSEMFQNYSGSSQDPKSRTVDATQEELQCCGAHNYTDWLDTSWFRQTGGVGFPHSCCNTTFPSCTGSVDKPWQLYLQGCRQRLEIAFHFELCLILFGSILVFLAEICLLPMIIHLMSEPPLMNYQRLDKN